jgi:hypothetical protein
MLIKSRNFVSVHVGAQHAAPLRGLRGLIYVILICQLLDAFIRALFWFPIFAELQCDIEINIIST